MMIIKKKKSFFAFKPCKVSIIVTFRQIDLIKYEYVLWPYQF